MRVRVATLAEAMCGVTSRFGSRRSGSCLGSGSVSVTSIAAQAIAREPSARSSAVSSTTAPRDVFTKDLDLPRGRERRPVRERYRVYEIDGTDSRLLATVGAFRVVAESDLHDGREDSRRAQRHLEQEGLLRTSPLSSDDRAVVLTDRGRDLLEAHRYERDDRSHEPRQAFWAGLRKPRELTHDTQVYRAYQRTEERLKSLKADLAKLPQDSKEAAMLTRQIANVEQTQAAARKRFEASSVQTVYGDILWGLFNSTEFTFNH